MCGVKKEIVVAWGRGKQLLVWIEDVSLHLVKGDTAPAGFLQDAMDLKVDIVSVNCLLCAYHCAVQKDERGKPFFN